MILVFLLSLIAISTYKLNEKQSNKILGNEADFGIHFVKSEIALPDFSLPNLFADEEVFSNKDLAEKKYSLINFFASWCATCRAEHEVLMKLKNSGTVDIYGVAWHDISENTKNYLSQSGNPFKKVAVDSKGILGSTTAIKAIPETWIVDNKGKIIWIFRGNLQEFSLGEIQNIILE